MSLFGVFWSVFSRIWTEYGSLRRKSPSKKTKIKRMIENLEHELYQLENKQKMQKMLKFVLT